MKKQIEIINAFSPGWWSNTMKKNKKERIKTNLSLVFLISLAFFTAGIMMIIAAYAIKDTHLVRTWITLSEVSILFMLLSIIGKGSLIAEKALICAFPMILYIGSLYTIYGVTGRANFISAIVCLVLIPSMFIITPVQASAENTIAVLLCVWLNHINPHPSLPETELSLNYVLCGIGGILFGVYTGYVKLLSLENARRIKENARMDAGLDILSRKSFFSDYKDEASREKLDSIFMIDINHFKNLNDTYGHRFGDKCLEVTAESLKMTGGRYNIRFYRYGGDEFIGAMEKDGTIKDRSEVVNAIREDLSKCAILSPDGPITLSISIGYEEYCKDGRDLFEECIQGADRSMYENKRKMHEERI